MRLPCARIRLLARFRGLATSAPSGHSAARQCTCRPVSFINQADCHSGQSGATSVRLPCARIRLLARFRGLATSAPSGHSAARQCTCRPVSFINQADCHSGQSGATSVRLPCARIRLLARFRGLATSAPSGHSAARQCTCRPVSFINQADCHSGQSGATSVRLPCARIRLLARFRGLTTSAPSGQCRA